MLEKIYKYSTVQTILMLFKKKKYETRQKKNYLHNISPFSTNICHLN